MAAETSLFELVFVLGPMLVAAFVVVTARAGGRADRARRWRPSSARLWIARLPVMRQLAPATTPDDAARGLGPLRAGGFPALLLCVVALGIAFGAAGVIVPAYATQHGGGDGLGGVLLGVWGVGSAIGGIWFGTRPPAMALPRQFAWLLGAVSVSFLVLAVMPGPLVSGRWRWCSAARRSHRR